MVDQIASNFYAAGFEDVVSCDPKNRTTVDSAGRDNPSLERRGRFAHANTIKHLLRAHSAKLGDSFLTQLLR